jgi:DNA repair exonuclease SbcCD ATPase subunit
MSQTELVKVNPAEFGLTDDTAKNIQAQFDPMLKKMVELEEEFNQVVVLPIDDLNTAKKAKELRLKYVKIRTGTAEIHKSQKAFYLNGGRFVDGWKNAQLFASQSKEERLESIEKHLENLEKKRIEDLNLLRVELIRPYVFDTTATNFGTMPEDVWNAYYQTKKKDYEDRIAAEKKAEEERIAKEKQEAEEREQQRLENIRLKEEAERRNAELKAEREANEARERSIREEAERKLAEERRIAKEETDRKEAAAKKEREELDAKLEEQRKENARIEKELQEKRDADLKAQQEKEAAELKAKKEAEKLAKAPIKKQLTIWVDSFVSPETPIENEKKALILEKFEAFKKWAKSEIESI